MMTHVETVPSPERIGLDLMAIAAGAPIMVIVPIATAYVDANFKESQFKRIRIGQPVEDQHDGRPHEHHVGHAKRVGGGRGRSSTSRIVS
mgnify:CR=1 FL=1